MPEYLKLARPLDHRYAHGNRAIGDAMSTAVPSAFVPRVLGSRAGNLGWEIVAGACGVVLLSVLAQVSIPLPWTPVPITGQTFGVTLIALLFGKRAVPVVVSYLALGAAGLPVFAAGKFGLAWGPTVGYLIGMVFSAGIAGFLADRGFTRSWPRAMVAGFAGSAAVFTCGLLVLLASRTVKDHNGL
jgi:biotin transport system substrate-specific component